MRVGALRPAGVWHRYPGSEDLTGLRLDELVHPVGAEPLGDDHEQRPAVLASEHARRRHQDLCWRARQDSNVRMP